MSASAVLMGLEPTISAVCHINQLEFRFGILLPWRYMMNLDGLTELLTEGSEADAVARQV